MAPDVDGTGWMCGGAVSIVNLHRTSLHRVSAIVREIGEPCLHRSPAKAGSKMLKPEKWQTVFDGDGKLIGFRKVLKLIILGGVDPSIRAEVWEFLLGCYTLGSTAEYRRQLRRARRERYEDLVRQCQLMHSSIGTGTLAYVIGSKVMDMRTPSKDIGNMEASTRSERASFNSRNNVDAYSGPSSNCIDSSNSHQRRASNCSSELVSNRENAGCSGYDNLFSESSSMPIHSFSKNHDREYSNLNYVSEGYTDFPALPVTNLFQRNDWYGEECDVHDSRVNISESLVDENMHSFHVSNNVDLVMEATQASPFIHEANGGTGLFTSEISRPVMHCNSETVSRFSSIAREESRMSTITSKVLNTNEDRVSEWLWTLHQIVVDVVRTDNHLDFYGDTKNMARMSDILAVYAWIDPATGYCQGMSDLLSPFVVLYEDDADAFWCFEMLLRRMRANFQMEGPTGVMKQLQALWKILELTDSDLYDHLSLIGAESLHFVFRMLLVLFRRELSFNEALRMWEMMWAADFDEAVARQLDRDCLEPLVIHLHEVSNTDSRMESVENGKRNCNGAGSNCGNQQTYSSHNNESKSASSYPLCGLTKANFWAKHDNLHFDIIADVWRTEDDEMPVFCAAAILIINRYKIMRETRSIDDVIRMFNDNRLKISVKRCIRMGIRLRKKYFCKLIKQAAPG